MSDEAPGFERHVRALFTQFDRDSMEFRLDLWDYDDVRQDAEVIYASLENGSMPCSEPWPTEDVALFRAWIDAGMLP
jgi:hypothetical protein